MKTKILILAMLFSPAVWAGCSSRTATAVEGDEVVSTNTVVVCENGPALPKVKRNVKIGDEVLENELPKVKNSKRFTHKQSECRMFRESYMLNEKVYLAHGVICHLDTQSDFWQVVDKW